MATLKAMFRLFDGYSTTIDKISKKTDEATNKILKASGSSDKFNDKLKATGASAAVATGSLSKLIGTFITLAAVQKGVDIIDTYTNTTARLSLINDGLQTQAQLQEKIFAAADRSKGAYTDMASAISKMGLLAADQFKSNNELIAFTELLQKSFKVGGASQTEQSSALLQLTQAMGAGKLQGDEFRSIMENAPLIADAISKYVGVSKGELKELSSEGMITADIIKNAMFAMSNDINAKFETMPTTFADVWTEIKNGGLEASQTLMESINNLINTDGFETFVNNAITGINMLATSVSWLIDFIISNWDVIWPILATIGGTLLINIIMKLWAMLVPLAMQFSMWMMMNLPIMNVIFSIIMIATVLNMVGVTMQDVFAFMGGSIGVLLALFTNLGVEIGNVFIGIGKLIETVIYGAINFVLRGVNRIIEALNSIPGVEIGSVSELQGVYSQMDYLKPKSLTGAYNTGAQVGRNVYTGMSNKLSDFTSKFNVPSNKNTFDMSSFGAGGLGDLDKPLKVKGTGKNGAVDVDMADDDLKYLRDIAEREYINKFSTATLAPNITVTFGDIHEEADANKVAVRIKKILQEEIAMASEGVYA